VSRSFYRYFGPEDEEAAGRSFDHFAREIFGNENAHGGKLGKGLTNSRRRLNFPTAAEVARAGLPSYPDHRAAIAEANKKVRKPPYVAPFYTRTIFFAKTGSGQTLRTFCFLQVAERVAAGQQTSIYHGVHWTPHRFEMSRRWQASVCLPNSEARVVGLFVCEEAAARAWCEKHDHRLRQFHT
jgi:hypothetical protein